MNLEYNEDLSISNVYPLFLLKNKLSFFMLSILLQNIKVLLNLIKNGLTLFLCHKDPNERNTKLVKLLKNRNVNNMIKDLNCYYKD